MAIVNFIFKNNKFGKMPENVYIKGEYGFYYLGESDELNLQKIKEFDPVVIDSDTAEGFNLLKITQIPINPNDLESTEMRDLTEEELNKKHKAQKFLKKIDLRSKIYAQIGDLDDLVADLSKRVGMLERLTVRTLHWLYFNSSIGTELPEEFVSNYGTLLSAYINDLDNQRYIDRVDIEDNTIVYAKLKERYNKITNLVQEYLNY